MHNLHNASASMHTLEQMAEGKTVIHTLHPAVKMLTTACYIALVVSFGRYDLSGLIVFFFYPVILMALSETQYKPLLQRLLIALPFSLCAGLSNLFFDRGTALFISHIAVSYGILSFFSLMIKTLLTVMAVLILVATTSMNHLSYQLMRWRIPAVLVMQITLTYRYISVLLAEASTMVTAYRLRAPRKKGISLHDMGAFAGQLLIRSVDRAARVYDAMKCRGYRGAYSGSKVDELCMRDYFYLLFVCGILFLMRFVNFSVLLGNLL